jgi:hypothetical protein
MPTSNPKTPKSPGPVKKPDRLRKLNLGDTVLVDAFVQFGWTDDLSNAEKLTVLGLALLTDHRLSEQEWKAADVAEVVGLSENSVAATLRKLAKAYPGQIARLAWLDTAEHKQVAYHYKRPGEGTATATSDGVTTTVEGGHQWDHRKAVCTRCGAKNVAGIEAACSADASADPG